MFLYYVRHGEPNYEKDCLTEKGQKQAEAIAKIFKQIGIDKVYASTMGRATDTAKPTAKEFNLPIIPCPWAREDTGWNNYSTTLSPHERTWIFWDPKYMKEFLSKETRDAGYTFYNLPAYKDTNIKKGIEFTDSNVDAFMRELGYEHDREHACYKQIKENNEHVALFAHHAFGLAFLSSLLDIPYSFFSLRFDMCHTAYTLIEFKANKDGIVIPNVIHLSDDSHLHKEGLFTKEMPSEVYIEVK